MGVLYHRRSPLEHLWQLKDQLVNEGELVLETLVIDGDENTVLVPVIVTRKCVMSISSLPRWR